MVWIGIQGPCSLNEVEPIRRNGGTIFTSEDIHEMGPAEVGKRAGDLALRGATLIYMSFDIDVIDAGFSNGTGSVTMGALTAMDLLKILDELAKYPIGAMDLVENSPAWTHPTARPGWRRSRSYAWSRQRCSTSCKRRSPIISSPSRERTEVRGKGVMPLRSDPIPRTAEYSPS